MISYEKVPDVSHWNAPVRMALMKGRGIKRVLIKASEGTGPYAVDSAFKASRAQAIENGLLWSTYLYYRADQDARAQAKIFVDATYSDGLEPSEPLTLDLENIPRQGSVIASGNLLLCLQEIERLSSMRPLIYTRSSFWKLYYYAANGWAEFYPLHVAHYKDFYGPVVCFPWSPAGFEKWQYTDREAGPDYGTTSKQVDMSIAVPLTDRGTYPPQRELTRYLALAGGAIQHRQVTVREMYQEFRMQRRRNYRRG